jgi:hypothetical protein
MRRLIEQLGEFIGEACKAPSSEKKGYGKRADRKKDANKKRRKDDKEKVKEEEILDEAFAVQIRALQNRASKMYKDIADLHKDANQYLKDLRGNAESWKGKDDEYAKELEGKASVMESQLVQFSKLEELFGSLKLGKGRW